MDRWLRWSIRNYWNQEWLNTAEIARAVSKKGHKVEEHEVYKVIRHMLTKRWEHRQNETDTR